MAKGQFKIKELIDYTKVLFPLDWLDTKDWRTNEEEIYIDLSKKIDNYATYAFTVFAKSILSGEYIIRPYIIESLDLLKDTLVQDFLPNNDEFRQEIIKQYSELCGLLEFNINRYKQLITTLYNKYELSSPTFLVNAFSIHKQNGEGHVLAVYFDILFDVVRIDHLLSGDKDSLKALILHHSFLRNAIDGNQYDENFKKVIEILDQKSLFLLKKLLIDDGNEFDYLIDFKRQHYNVKTNVVTFFKDFDYWFDFYRANNHAEDSFVRDLYNKTLNNTIKVGQMALLMKFYKNHKDTSITQINNLVTQFDEKYTSLSKQYLFRKYDIYALSTLKNYMYNCRLSFKISNTDYTYDELEREMYEIENIQKETRILNFYPYLKSIGFIIKIIESEKTIPRPEVEKYFLKLDYFINKYEESLNWCEEQCFIPVQNIYNESITKVGDYGVVFVPSTFSRPINYLKQRHRLDEIKTKVLFLKNELNLREEKEEIELIKSEIDKSHLKNIELLSVFTAIITFLFGTVNFMSNNSTSSIFHQIYNTLSLGLVLLLFVSAIGIITMRREKDHKSYWMHPRLYFLIVTIVTFIILLGYLIHNIHVLAS